MLYLTIFDGDTYDARSPIVISILRDFLLFTGHNDKFVSPGLLHCVFHCEFFLAWALRTVKGRRITPYLSSTRSEEVRAAVGLIDVIPQVNVKTSELWL